MEQIAIIHFWYLEVLLVLVKVLEEPKKRGSYGSDSNNPFGMWKVRLLLVITIHLLDINTSMIFEFLLGF